MKDPFDSALKGAVAVLSELPRTRHDVENARKQFERFKAAHRGIRCDLVIHRPAGRELVDYDILLADSSGGTISISRCDDHGIPWLVNYSDHWAANFVLSVNDNHLSVQSALLYLNSVLRPKSDLMASLINRMLIAQALQEQPISVNDAEVRKAVDAFRRSQGLYTAAETERWLEQSGMKMPALRELVAINVQTRKLRKRLTARLVRPYFNEHRADFDRLTVFRINLPDGAQSRAFARARKYASVPRALNGKKGNMDGWSTELTTSFLYELPEEVRSASASDIVRSRSSDNSSWIAQVLERRDATLDRRTRAHIEKLLFSHWLKERASSATIQWHWM